VIEHRPSRYNFPVVSQDGRVAVFNARTGGIVELEGDGAAPLARALSDPNFRFDDDSLPAQTLTSLCRGGCLIGRGQDELVEIRDRYWRARGETPTVVTITTTMSCNLGCYYCYEERSGDRLETDDVASIVAMAADRVRASGRAQLHVDWYGGEPLLNLSFLEEASAALRAFCVAEGVTYAASIISNGTEWPDDVEAFVARHAIGQAQISFDGLKRHHDKRRRFLGEPAGAERSSFERAVALVDRLVDCTRVDLRFNIDRANAEDLMPFLDFAEQRGWFAAFFPAVFQPARLASYSARSAFMRNSELSLEEFDRLRAAVRERLNGKATVEESEAPDGYPHPRTSVCAALADNSVVIGAEGATYRCGLQVGERGRSVGHIASRDRADVPGAGADDRQWWAGFDPTALPSCRSCSFLPICWGGCPKKHLEGDSHALAEQGAYWRQNLPRMIRAAAGHPPSSEPIPRELQFRDEPRTVAIDRRERPPSHSP
jgi:uncharacterized protein